MKRIIKKATPLSFLLTLLIGTTSINCQANEINELFLSNNNNGIIALNSVRGKPPHNRNRMRSQRKKSLKIVEMSALEASHGNKRTYQISGKKFRRGGHPEKSKNY